MPNNQQKEEVKCEAFDPCGLPNGNFCEHCGEYEPEPIVTTLVVDETNYNMENLI